MKHNNKIIIILAILFSITSCKKLIKITPPASSVSSSSIYTNDAEAIGSVTNIYASMSTRELISSGGITSLNLFPGLSADEFSLYPGTTNDAVNYFYSNALSAVNSPDSWTALYAVIYSANVGIEGLSASSGLTPAVKQQLTGEVKFMRAFCYFYLVNLYGDVPLVLTSNYTINTVLPRAAQADVYKQIVSDLKDAKDLLSARYLDGTLLNATGEKVRPTKWAAGALLARVYLYMKDYTNAGTEASNVINNTSLFGLNVRNDVFLKNSREAIWQLQPVNAGWNTEDAKTFIIPSSGPNTGYYSFYLSPQILSSFEYNDQRRKDWVDSITVGQTYYYPYKYKSANYQAAVTEYEMVLRLGEQYLVRAEAKAALNDLAGAASDLDSIRLRAGLPGVAVSTQSAMLASVLHERQVELFSEWGHRWLDLKRTGKVDAVMSAVTPQKGGTWNTNWQWYPLATSELLRDPNLAQNKGY